MTKNMYTHYLSIMQDTFKNNWNNPALCNYKGEEFTFEQVALNIEKFHIFFENAGIRKGDKISLCARNSARWAVSFLAINTFQAVVVPILSDFLPSTAAGLVNHSGSVMLFTDKDIWEKMDPDGIPGLKAVVNCADFTLLYAADESVRKAFDGISESFDRKFPMGFGRDNLRFPTGNDSDLAVINYTSGTTSAPKGVMLRYECFSAMIDFATSRVSCSADDTLVSMLPMGHIYGLAFEFLFPISQGVTIYYFGKTPSPSLLLKAMQDIRPFMVVTVPLVMEKVYKSSIRPLVSRWYMKLLLGIPVAGGALYRKIGRKLMEAFGGKVRHFIMGGAALSPEVDKAFHRMRLPYTVGYGMTEAAPLLGYEDWTSYVPGSCGKSVACCEIRIDSEDPQHVAGEILARGANICSGYYNNPQASANAFTDDGFLRTGDLGIIDKDGNIFIKGRCKTMILSASGQNIYPEEIEAVINAEPFVAESLVLDRASKLVALIYLDQAAVKKAGLDDEAASDIPENIRISVNRQMPQYSRITKVEVVSEPFEKTPKMSIKRFLYK
ncbi:MAG: AMP-binding protein [Bacteroidales bacterium]|nr:AMP-binding protein [Bacteroidales bacterium]